MKTVFIDIKDSFQISRSSILRFFDGVIFRQISLSVQTSLHRDSSLKYVLSQHPFINTICFEVLPQLSACALSHRESKTFLS